MFFLLLFLSASRVYAHAETQIIKMIPGGFEPAEVSIDENSAVIFVNQDTVGRWPASNLHPTHDLYPEFDPKKEIKPGESWAFKPKNVGVWKYHDHNNPHLRGVLTVASETEEQKDEGTEEQREKPLGLVGTVRKYVNSILGWFRSLSKKTPNAEEFKKLDSEKQFEALETIANKKGGRGAWDFIINTYKGEAGSSGNIHDLAHLSGKLIFEDSGIEGVSKCSQVFAFGCYHGFLDAAFSESLYGLKTAEKECAKLGPSGSGPYGSCVHGIGHGVASFYKSHDLEEALKSCNILPAGQAFCHDGVFMEFARGARSEFYRQGNLLYPCDELEKKYDTQYSTSCGRNQPSVLISRLGLKFDGVSTICVGNEMSGEFKSACVDALGFMLAGSKDVRSIISGCKSIGSDEYVAGCLKAAAGELIFQEVSGWQISAPQVCAASPVSTKSVCDQYLEKLKEDYGRS